MKCPNCNTTLMPAQRGQAAVDYCPSCWGIWLDRSDLDAMIRQSRTSDESAESVARVSPLPIPPTIAGVH
jgi:Zn-finger nucleic acid-binding protein